MSNPNYVHTITLFSRQADGSYKKTVLTGCFWKSAIAVTQNGTQAAQSNVYTVRISAEKAPKGFGVTLGDIVVHGKCPDKITDAAGSRVAEILNKYKPDAFKVTAFSDNTSHKMDKHYRLGG